MRRFPLKSFVFVLTFFCLCFVSCSNEKNSDHSEDHGNIDPSDCLYDSPVPIFAPIQAQLEHYLFQETGPFQTSEQFSFKDIEVEILQTGCNQVYQEFRFTTDSSLGVVDFASNIFNEFSALDQSLFALNQFANEFQRQKDIIETNQLIQFSDIIYLKMDETAFGEKRLIRIVMKSEEN